MNLTLAPSLALAGLIFTSSALAQTCPPAGMSREQLLELKSLRDFLGGFRSREIFQEEVVNEVVEEIGASAAPVRAEVEGVFNVRGGMTTRVVARS